MLRGTLMYAGLLVVGAEYSQDRALTFAKLASAAYCDTDVVKSWTCGYKCSANVSDVKVCQGAGTRAFVARWEGDACVMSFQGSGPTNMYSFVQDLKSATMTDWEVCDNCRAGKGFLLEWKSLEECVKTSLREIGCPEGSQIRGTGHSLGAAVNSLAMLDLNKNGWQMIESYDFGKPRIGNANLVQTFNNKFAGNSWRVTRKHDPVPNLPPVNLGLENTDPEIYYPGNVPKGYVLCTHPDKTQCVEQYWNIPVDILLHIPDHLSYMDINTGHRGCDNGAGADVTIV